MKIIWSPWTHLKTSAPLHHCKLSWSHHKETPPPKNDGSKMLLFMSLCHIYGIFHEVSLFLPILHKTLKKEQYQMLFRILLYSFRLFKTVVNLVTPRAWQISRISLIDSLVNLLAGMPPRITGGKNNFTLKHFMTWQYISWWWLIMIYIGIHHNIDFMLQKIHTST